MWQTFAGAGRSDLDFQSEAGNLVDQGLIPACADNVCLAHCINFTST